MTRASNKWFSVLALLSGCASVDEGVLPSLPPRLLSAPPPVATYQPADMPASSIADKPAVPDKVVPVKAELPASAEPPEKLPPPVDNPGAKTVPVTLDAVLKLAEEQNSQVAVARERINQACVEQELAAKRILPEINVGTGYWRHEGGIQLQEGPLIRSSTQAVLGGLDITAKLDLKAATFARIDAARKTLQQQGELKRISTEVMLDAASTYIDLLAAHSGLAIARNLDGELRKLLDRAEKLANLEKGARIEVVRIRAEINGQAQTVRKLEAQAKAAAGKLAYLLGLDSATELVPVDEQLVAYRLVDVARPLDALTAQALSQGPGLREIEGILGVIQEGMAKAESPQRWLPVFEARAVEGVFGAGANDNMVFANRLDVGVQARWNLTDLCSANANRRLACSLYSQTQITYADIKAKLALGVREAREAAVSGEQELALATEQILQAKNAAELSDMRLTEGIAGSSFGEVLLSKKSVAGAQANYLGVLRDFDKAQLRLLVLCGVK